MPAESSRDRAVVVGSGHNSLVAACYLAGAGLDVEVVERDGVAGGAVSTVERFPGYLMDRGSSAHIMIRHTGIVEELELAAMGLEYQDLDPWGFAPFGETAIEFWVDLNRTCESIAALCGGREAQAYRRFALDWSRRNEAVFRAFQSPPAGGQLLRAAWQLRRDSHTSSPRLVREFLSSADALLDAHFTDERLKTALAWLGSQSGPATHERATADLVGWNTVMHRLAPGHPRGGSGMLSVALQRRLEASGGRVRLGDGARRVDAQAGRVTGVITDSGERLPAGIVVAGCHLFATLDLLDQVLPDLAARTRRSVHLGNGIGMVVRLATTDLPRYAAAGPRSHHALQLLATSRRQLRAAHAAFTAGQTPHDPPVLAMTFSAFDDTLAPPGRHNVSVWGQWHPYALAGGVRWEAIRQREADKLVAAVDAAAPGFASSVLDMHVQTPVDLERELGLPAGQVMHLPMALGQMFAFRPTPELSRYEVPGLAGLYLCGASTHPGGGVFGASGRSAARAALRGVAHDRRGRGRRA
ncbi:MAG: NAD(P)/FAD-dependent oxidoreductase [Actinomycetota bacterium]|nr:NAD(P)/FAD-dependent oxidoreductase [Actinomycetota bacterium]